MRFDQVAIAIVLCAGLVTACEKPGYVVCGEQVCPEGTQCLDNQCVSDGQVAACAGKVEEDAVCAVTDLDGLCRDGYCQVDLCGNGRLDTYPVRGDEACDGDLGLVSCADAGADFGATTCSAACGLDSKACQSFSWRRSLVGQGAGRAVVVEADGVFAARGSYLSWRQGTGWKNTPKLTSTILDIVPLGPTQGLVVSARNAMTLGIWHFVSASDELVPTNLSIPLAGTGRWSGGTALDASHVLASVSQGLRLYSFDGTTWTERAQTLVACPAGDLGSLWASSATVAYAAAGTQVLRLVVSGATATCSVIKDLGQPVVALGGQGGVLQWAVDGVGRVYDAATWTTRNLDATATLAVDAAVAQPVSGASPRLWASSGENVYLFEAGSWWKSNTGSVVLRDDLDGHLGTHRPVAAIANVVYAVQPSVEAGLVQRNDREWFTGWEPSGGASVAELAVDDNGQAWTLLDDGRVSFGSRQGTLTPALVPPLSRPAIAGGVLFVGTNTGVFRIVAAGANFTSSREGSAVGGARGVWASADGSLYQLSTLGLYKKTPGVGDWVPLIVNGAGTECPIPIALSGLGQGSAERVFAVCRMQSTAPLGYRLLVVALPSLTPTVLALPDFNYRRVVAQPDGTVWMVAAGRVVQAAPPYVAATPQDVFRRSPATGKLDKLPEALTDLAVTSDGSVYLSARRQNLFVWDGTRFLRVSSSQSGTLAYVALASRGAHLYAAYESGVDLLFRSPVR
jgi:hypothetical protein